MLQINLVIEDAKISLDELQEEIAEIEDHVQSSDVAGEHVSRTKFATLANLSSYAKALGDRYDRSREAEVTDPHALHVLPLARHMILLKLLNSTTAVSNRRNVTRQSSRAQLYSRLPWGIN